MRLREIKHGRLAMAAFAFHYAGVLLEKKGVVVRPTNRHYAPVFCVVEYYIQETSFLLLYCVCSPPTEEGLISWISTRLFVFIGSCVVCARCAASVPHGCKAGLVDVVAVVVVVVAIITVLETYFAPRAPCLGLFWTWIARRFTRRLYR